MNKFYRLTVSNVEKLTEDSVKISFDIPELLKKEFSFDAGQYLTLQQTIDNQKIRRAYSICSAINESELSVAVKRIPNGIFSTYVTTILKAGDTLEVMPPQGNFIFLPQFFEVFEEQNIMLFSAGSGVTPMMSIAKTALTKTNIKVVFVFGNKSKEEALFFDEIEQLKTVYPERFFVHYVFSQKLWKNSFFGRIDDRIVGQIFQAYRHLDFGRYYVCGPAEMVINVRDLIFLRGIPSEKVSVEFFKVMPIQPPSNFLQNSENVNVKVVFDGKETFFETTKNQNLLSSVLQHGIEAPYSCRNGVCSSCIAKVIEGEVKMAKNETLVDQEIAAGLVLTCQAYAISDAVKLTYDV